MATPCPACSYTNPDDALTCGMCMGLLNKASDPASPTPATAPAEAPRFGTAAGRARDGLGRKTRTYEAKAGSIAGFTAAGLAFAAVGFVMVFNLQEIERWAGATIFWALGAAMLLWAFSQVGRAIELYEHGLIERQGGKETVIRYADVRGVFQNHTENYVNGVYTGTTHEYKVKCRDGRELVISDEIADVTTLGEELIRAMATRDLADMQARFDAGEIVEFGPVSVSKANGIRIGTKRLLPWAEVGDVAVHEGYLRLGPETDDVKQTFRQKIAVREIPNLQVFLTLVAYGAANAG